MTWKTVAIILVGCALGGMLLGGLLGLVSAMITPRFFAHLIPWDDVGPVGFTTFCGGVIGLICGAIVGLIGLIIQLICDCQHHQRAWWLRGL